MSTLALIKRWGALYQECLQDGDFVQAGICSQELARLWPQAKRAA